MSRPAFSAAYAGNMDKSGDAYTAGRVYSEAEDLYRIGTVKYSWPASGEKLFIESQPPNVSCAGPMPTTPCYPSPASIPPKGTSWGSTESRPTEHLTV
jgi:hypothetical protein